LFFSPGKKRRSVFAKQPIVAAGLEASLTKTSEKNLAGKRENLEGRRKNEINDEKILM